jgi:hypothetical protein
MPGQPTERIAALAAGPDAQMLKKATDQEIIVAISEVYLNVAHQNAKPPNLKEIVKPVLAKLAQQGSTATYARIYAQAEQPEFVRLRRRPGRTLKAELREPSGKRNQS